MKEGWKVVKLGEVCEILDNLRQPISKGKRISGTIPYYGATGCLDYVKDYLFNEKLVLLGEDGAKWGSGDSSAFIIDGKSWINNHAHVLRPKREMVIDEILVYYLNYANLQSFISGVTVPKLNQERMRSIPIPLPPLPEQHRIVKKLDAAFEKIDAMKANAEKNIENAKALFQQTLAEELEPKDGWVEKKLGEVCEASNGLWKGKKPPYKKIAVIRNTNFSKDCKLNLENVEYIDVEERQYISRKLEYGDIIIEKSGGSDKQPVGRPILFNVLEGDFSYSNFTSRLRINDLGSVDALYLHKALYHLYLQGATSSLQSNTTGIHNLNLKGYLELHIPLPPLPEQQQIVTKLDILSAKCKKLEEAERKTIAECDALKQAILRQAFNGEL